MKFTVVGSNDAAIQFSDDEFIVFVLVCHPTVIGESLYLVAFVPDLENLFIVLVKVKKQLWNSRPVWAGHIHGATQSFQLL